jgi:proton-dependent oligopeptide transporter, POT family
MANVDAGDLNAGNLGQNGKFPDEMSGSKRAGLWNQPRGVYLVAFTDFWERVSFTGMLALLVIFLTSTKNEGGLGWDTHQALRVFGVFTGCAYCLPTVGGWLADRWIGERKAIIAGGIGILTGNTLIFALSPTMSSPTVHAVLYGGLAAIALGTSLLKPSIAALIGRIYDERPNLPRSVGYTVFLMCIYLGTIVGPVVSGLFGELGTFKWGFLVAALGMMVGLLSFVTGAPRLLGNVGNKPRPKHDYTQIDSESESVGHRRSAIIAISVMTFFAAVYNVAFYQKAGVLALMIKSSTARTVHGFEIPAAAFMGITALGFLLLAPLVEVAMSALARRSIHVDPLAKQIAALLMLAIGYIFLISAAKISVDPTVHHSIAWIIAAYFCFSLGEALTWPVQLSTISRIAPPGLTGALIGLFYVATGVGSALAGFVGIYAETLGLVRYFVVIQIVLVVAAVALLLVRAGFPAIRKIVSA